MTCIYTYGLCLESISTRFQLQLQVPEAVERAKVDSGSIRGIRTITIRYFCHSTPFLAVQALHLLVIPRCLLGIGIGIGKKAGEGVFPLPLNGKRFQTLYPTKCSSMERQWMQMQTSFFNLDIQIYMAYPK